MDETRSEDGSPMLDPLSWLDRHGDYLFRYAWYRLRDRDAAEDAVQETFLAALKAQSRYQGSGSERSWLTGILKHKIIDHFRKNSRERPSSDEKVMEDLTERFFDDKGNWLLKPAKWGVNPRKSLEDGELWEAFFQCLEEIPARMARAFTLRELEGMGNTEAADIMGITPNNFGVILHRARALLRQCLEAHWTKDGR